MIALSRVRLQNPDERESICYETSSGYFWTSS